VSVELLYYCSSYKTHRSLCQPEQHFPQLELFIRLLHSFVHASLQ